MGQQVVPRGQRATPFGQRGHRVEGGRALQRHQEGMPRARVLAGKGTAHGVLQGGLQDQNENYLRIEAKFLAVLNEKIFHISARDVFSYKLIKIKVPTLINKI